MTSCHIRPRALFCCCIAFDSHLQFKCLYLSTDLDPVVLEKTKLYILLNHETEVYCKKPNGIPQPTITWQKADDQPLPKKFDVEGCCTLKKNRTKQIDSGNYTCIAKNMAGTEFSTVEIIVSGELAIYFNCSVKFVLTNSGFIHFIPKWPPLKCSFACKFSLALFKAKYSFEF